MRFCRLKLEKIKCNKKGYTLIEVLIVVFMLVALLSIAVGSYTAYYRARGSKISKTIDTMIAQSKIDALSGRENIMVIRHKTDYDDSEDGMSASKYYAELYSVEGTKAVRYKKEGIGNNWVSINLGDNDDISESRMIVLKFNVKTGAITYLNDISPSSSGEGSEDYFAPPSSEDEATGGVVFKLEETPTAASETIKIKSARPYAIQMWIASGEHIISDYKIND